MSHEEKSPIVAVHGRDLYFRLRKAVRNFWEEGRSPEWIAQESGGIVALSTVRYWIHEWKKELAATPPALPESNIVCFIGRRGSGKTLSAAWVCRQHYEAGRKVFYNPPGLLNFQEYDKRLKFTPPASARCEFMSIVDFAMLDEDTLRDSIFLWDEPQETISKFRSSSRLNYLLRRVTHQVRKVGLDLVLATNSPGQLDAGLAAQIDMHVRCKAYLPPKHWADEVWLQWVDTQQQFGIGAPVPKAFGRPDTRVRIPTRLKNASEVFRYYNTHALKDVAQEIGMDSDKWMTKFAERDAGWTIKDLGRWVRDVYVPELVAEGATHINPSLAVEQIALSYVSEYAHTDCCRSLDTGRVTPEGCAKGIPIPFVIDDAMLGKACAFTGLARVRTRGGSAWRLPPPDKLVLWQEGKWHDDAVTAGV